MYCYYLLFVAGLEQLVQINAGVDFSFYRMCLLMHDVTCHRLIEHKRGKVEPDLADVGGAGTRFNSVKTVRLGWHYHRQLCILRKNTFHDMKLQ